MAHHVLKSSHSQLADRLNRFPQSTPPSQLLYKILALLFSEKEAELVDQLPIKSFTVEKACQIRKLSLTETRKILEELAGQAGHFGRSG
jgi:hypothetical protein